MAESDVKPFLPAALLVLATSCSTSEPEPPQEQLPRTLTEQQLQAMPTERIWELGVQRFAWRPARAPEDRTKGMMIEAFLIDQKFRAYDDRADYGTLELERLRALGYVGE